MPFAFPRSMTLPGRVGDAAELRKVGAGGRGSWQVGWVMATFPSVVSAPSLPPSRSPAEPEAAAGEAPARADQPEPEPAEGSSVAAAGRRGECLGTRKTEVEGLGAPSEVGGPAWFLGSMGDLKTCVSSARWSGKDLCATGEHLGARRRCSVYCGVSLWSGLAQGSRSSKLEKADILEMTVRFLQEQPASLYSTAAPGE